MRASNMDRVISIYAPTNTPDANGTPQTTWALFATVRAQLIERVTGEMALRDFGEDTDITTIFRMRWLDGVTLSQKVTYNGQDYRLAGVKEIGRREWMDLRAIAVVA